MTEEKNRPKLVAQGYIDGAFIREGYVKSLTMSANGSGYDGKKLDNLFVQAELDSKKDFDDLIDFLKLHKHCFIR